MNVRSLLVAAVLVGGCGGVPVDGEDGGTLDAGTVGSSATRHAATSQASSGHVSGSGAGATDGGVKPEDPGPFAVSTYDAALHVPGGLAGRTVNLRAYVPGGASSAPVVVIHPGFQLAGSLYASYAEHLASLGTVAVIVSPPYAVLGGPNHKELAEYLGKVVDWVASESTDGGLSGVADPTRLALAGHSWVERSPCCWPPRTHGPWVCLPLTRWTSTAATNEIEIVGANHMSFLDDPQCGLTCSVCSAGTDDPAETRRLTRRYLTAFVNMVLRNDSTARDWLAGAGMQGDVTAGLVHQQTFNGF